MALLLAGLSACGGSSSSALTGDPGSGGGSGDGSGGGSGATTLLNVTDVATEEPDSGTTVLTFLVTLTQPREIPITVSYATQDGTAKSTGDDADYLPASGSLLFEPGATAKEVRVFVNGDQAIEPNETFVVALSNATGFDVAIGAGQAQGLILNDDSHELKIFNVETPEGDFSTHWVDLPVTLSTPSSSTITVQYATQNTNGKGAHPEGDYTWRRGTVTFEPGTVQKFVSVLVRGDLVPEVEERFAIVLFDPTGFDVVIEDDRALVRILDDDEPVHIDDEPGAGGADRPMIAQSGDLVGTLWVDDRSGSRGLYFDRSTDDGWSWTSLATRVDHAPAGIDVYDAALAITGERVYAVWSDGRDGKSDVFLNYSTDGGQTWQGQDVRLDTDAPGDAASVRPRIVAQEGRVYVAWEDFRGGSAHVRFNRSIDGGASWEANDLRISDPAGFGAPAYDVSLAARGDEVFVVWADRRSGAADIYLDSSTDAGLTWRAADLMVEQDRPGESTSEVPQVVCSEQGVYVVWEDTRNGERDIYFNRSLDGGDTWNTTDRRMEDDPAGAYASVHPRIACDGLHVVVTWEDYRSGLPDVFSMSSPDAGFTWGPNLRLSRGGPVGFSRSIEPEVAFNGESVIVTWLDDRDGQFDPYMNHSVNAGQNFHQDPQRLDGTNDTDSGHVHVLAHGPRFQVVWREHREGGDASDVLFRSIEYYP